MHLINGRVNDSRTGILYNFVVHTPTSKQNKTVYLHNLYQNIK